MLLLALNKKKTKATRRQLRQIIIIKKYVEEEAGREVMLLKSIIHWDISDLSRGLKVLYKARKGHLS